MKYVQVRNWPDLFIPFTCNPSWPEIQESQMPGQQATDPHDIIARVFQLKNLMDILIKGEVFGPDQCYMHTIEWHKRGFPHAHILLWLKKKIHSSTVEQIISAKIPDPSADTILQVIINKQMIR